MIPTDQKIYLVQYDESKIDFMNEITSSKAIIPKGNYEIQELIDLINEKIFKLDNKLTLFEENMPRIIRLPKLKLSGENVLMDIGEITASGYVYVKFDKILGNILGFPINQLMKRIKNKYSTYPEKGKLLPPENREEFNFRPYDLNISKYIKLTSDLNIHSNFGEEIIPLLGVVNIPAIESGKQIYQFYENPVYYPINKMRINRIILGAIDNKGDKFNFEDFYITIHLKKVYEKVPDRMLEPFDEGDD